MEVKMNSLRGIDMNDLDEYQIANFELDLVKEMGNMDIFPGQRVEVYDHIDETYQKGTVIRRYGKLPTSTSPWNYPDLVDVKQDRVRMKHYPEGDEWRDISKGHFTYGVKKI
jgi:hypothetical protein